MAGQNEGRQRCRPGRWAITPAAPDTSDCCLTGLTAAQGKAAENTKHGAVRHGSGGRVPSPGRRDTLDTKGDGTFLSSGAEFLKIDFPRIPWPASPDAFWNVSAKGTMLRKLHLMDPAAIGPTPYPFRGEGDAIVEAPRYADGKVWINRTQYFADVPGVSWTFFIGGYQPAQKWLKDRKGRALSFDDVKHYQKIIRILAETDRIMQAITLMPGARDEVS
ncbi:MAG: hypothetical protein LW703_02345 [Rhodobacter sp.]|nr:hypothetical protein [Rhodobacter sp.]